MADLLYTIAFDFPGESWHRTMASMAVRSILQTGFGGDVLVFTNRTGGLSFPTKQVKIVEVSVPVNIDGGAFALYAQQFKYRARHFIKSCKYGTIMFADCDVLFFRNPSNSFDPEFDLCYAEEQWPVTHGPWNNSYLTDSELESLQRPGINSGLFWVQAPRFDEVLRHWEMIDASPPCRHKLTDQPAWNRLVLDTNLRTKSIQAGGPVSYPMTEWRTERDFAQSDILHFNASKTPEEKVTWMFSHYFRHFHSTLIPATLLHLPWLGSRSGL